MRIALTNQPANIADVSQLMVQAKNNLVEDNQIITVMGGRGLNFLQRLSEDRTDLFDGCRILQRGAHIPGVIDDSQCDGRDRLQNISLTQIKTFGFEKLTKENPQVLSGARTASPTAAVVLPLPSPV
jgi:hypothetical protein